LRILEWIIGRCIKTAGARITPIGYVPKPEDLDLTGLSMSKETIEELLYVDKGAWLEEAKDIERFFKTFGSDLPVELKNELKALQERLMKE
ncbi:MAG TPA: phosphoenolpyruvate carboxykinase domain-containing protein, partial [Syntrophorhabdaceae bacterium]|nr:phosphoenolpyruvate carboxykinase domain-containing protein [Syntrophorhabdaceae bacterium]